MDRLKTRKRLLGKQVWCVDCLVKTPAEIKRSDFLVPVRLSHYDLTPDESAIDQRVVGICKECLKLKNDFQKNNAGIVNLNHKHLVYRNIKQN